MNNEECLIFDVNGIFCPIYFVRNEDFISSVQQFLTSLKNLLINYNDQKVIFACDQCNNNHRYKILKSYKELRVPNPRLKKSLIGLQNILQTYGLPIEGHSEYEADDIVASYSKLYKKSVIFGIDKDYFQLINNNVTIFHPFKKFYIDRKFVYDKFQVYPEQFALFQALCGDKSDCIPGIAGIGPKTAAKIISSNLHKEDFQKHFNKFNFTTLSQMLELTTLKIFDVKNITQNAQNVLAIIDTLFNDLQNKITPTDRYKYPWLNQ